jgi:hypothetical protein
MSTSMYTINEIIIFININQNVSIYLSIPFKSLIKQMSLLIKQIFN